ncbi:MAG: 16S rRNA (guanine(966)-N(2))-methyltransferase RsmD [Gemmatimonadetes bacterium]|nr:16S rRNA (guanine(966)-N(2))-methyltransferase RsmD [Gemmatimonadota bacterium]
MRIIAGEWRGRRIAAPKSGPVRPTADRVREAWMSIVQHELPDARVLDLFAGTGALGLEALSRGARWVDFVEADARTLRVLLSNVEGLEAGSRCATHRGDALRFAERLRTPDGVRAYDVCFADPPYRLGLAAQVAECWLAAPFATIFGVEHEARATLPDGGDVRRYGDSAITIYRAT